MGVGGEQQFCSQQDENVKKNHCFEIHTILPLTQCVHLKGYSVEVMIR